MPLERNPKAPATFRVGHGGKHAITWYKVLGANDEHSLIELKPETGRTHQLRVHLHHIGHPIIGDTLYGGEPAERMMLHAESLELTLPNRERKVFTTPMPKEFAEAVSD
jgi:23S rRNA-/tRNA-specific pseudouridylate synthase